MSTFGEFFIRPYVELRPALIIPFEQLSADALLGIVESFVVREGTDYGELEWRFEDKVGMLMNKVKSGQVLIVYDETVQEVNLMAREDFARIQTR